MTRYGYNNGTRATFCHRLELVVAESLEEEKSTFGTLTLDLQRAERHANPEVLTWISPQQSPPPACQRWMSNTGSPARDIEVPPQRSLTVARSPSGERAPRRGPLRQCHGRRNRRAGYTRPSWLVIAHRRMRLEQRTRAKERRGKEGARLAWRLHRRSPLTITAVHGSSAWEEPLLRYSLSSGMRLRASKWVLGFPERTGIRSRRTAVIDR